MATLNAKNLSTNWYKLVELYPLRPIGSDGDCRKALQVVRELSLLDRMTKDQSDYFDVLSGLIEQYEAKRWPIDTGGVSVIDVLKSFLADHGMTPSDLGRLLGDRSLGCKLLSGQRRLSLSHIKTLAQRFNVSPSLFIQ